MHLLLVTGLYVAAVPAVASCVYLALLTLLSGGLPLPARSQRQLRFDVIIPAHNEESVIAHVIGSVRRVDWPADRFRVVVVADNCTDATAAVASDAGAEILERRDERQRG